MFIIILVVCSYTSFREDLPLSYTHKTIRNQIMRFSNLIGKDGLLILLTIFLLWTLAQNHSLKNQLNRRYEPPDLLKAGDIIPFFSGTDIYGNWIDMDKNTLKEKIVLTIFRPNCPFCIRIAPFWNEMYDAIGGRDITMIGVTTRSDSLTIEFAEKHGLNYPILSTKSSPTGDSLSKYYKINVVPILILIKSNGTVMDVWPGYIEEDKQTNILSTLLSEKHIFNTQK